MTGVRGIVYLTPHAAPWFSRGRVGLSDKIDQRQTRSFFKKKLARVVLVGQNALSRAFCTDKIFAYPAQSCQYGLWVECVTHDVVYS
jgi:hypothetical protein